MSHRHDSWQYTEEYSDVKNETKWTISAVVWLFGHFDPPAGEVTALIYTKFCSTIWQQSTSEYTSWVDCFSVTLTDVTVSSRLVAANAVIRVVVVVVVFSARMVRVGSVLADVRHQQTHSRSSCVQSFQSRPAGMPRRRNWTAIRTFHLRHASVRLYVLVCHRCRGFSTSCRSYGMSRLCYEHTSVRL